MLVLGWLGPCSAQGGSDCASATLVPITLPFAGIGLTNCGSVDDYNIWNAPICGSASYTGGEDHLYSFVPGSSGQVSIQLNSPSSYVGLFVYEACPDTGFCVASVYGPAGNQSMLASVVAGTTYFVMVDSDPLPSCHPTYDLSISIPASFPLPTPEDCLGAIPLCDSINFVVEDPMILEGNYPNEINSMTSCLGGGEQNGRWYILYAQNDGDLCFSIVPTDIANDYDWAVFDMARASCLDIFMDATIEIRCNFSGVLGTTGANGLPGQQNEPCLAVSAGQYLALYVSNWQENFTGYAIHVQLPNSTASVIDTIAPVVAVDSGSVCAFDGLNIHFGGPVLCASIQPSDLVITGPGGPFVVTAISDQDCEMGAAYGMVFNVVTDPPIAQDGTYVISVLDTIADGCGQSTSSFSTSVHLGTSEMAEFTWQPDTLYLPDTVIQFTNLTPGAVACSWTFGSFGSSTECAPIITFPADSARLFPVELSVTDSFGCESVVMHWVLALDSTIVGSSELGLPSGSSLMDILDRLAATGQLEHFDFAVYDALGRLVLYHDRASSVPRNVLIGVGSTSLSSGSFCCVLSPRTGSNKFSTPIVTRIAMVR